MKETDATGEVAAAGLSPQRWNTAAPEKGQAAKVARDRPTVPERGEKLAEEREIAALEFFRHETASSGERLTENPSVEPRPIAEGKGYAARVRIVAKLAERKRRGEAPLKLLGRVAYVQGRVAGEEFNAAHDPQRIDL